MRQAYRRLMQRLYLGCIVLSGAGMVAITLIIPSGVFMRYVMNDPLQWPEPASVIMMVFFSFVGLPIPISGLLTLLFIIEKIWLGDPPRDDVMYSDAPADLE